jgi:mono/diheme cytochrome c family protein
MNGPTRDSSALAAVDKGARRCRFARREKPIFYLVCLLTIIFMMTVPIGSRAGRRGGQAGAHVSKPDVTSAGNAENGKVLFKNYGCYECHGSHGQIASRTGPALAPDLIAFEAFSSYVRQPSGSMPAYSDKVTSNRDLADIYEFLKSTPNQPSPKTIPILSFVSETIIPKELICLVSDQPTSGRSRRFGNEIGKEHIVYRELVTWVPSLYGW